MMSETTLGVKKIYLLKQGKENKQKITTKKY